MAVILANGKEVPVNMTMHVAVPAVVPAESRHGLPVKLPVTPVCESMTVPVGVVGLVEVSVTVAVQVVGASIGTELGEHVTDVVVGACAWVTVTLKAGLVLGASIESPP